MFQLLFRPLELCISKLWYTHTLTYMLYKLFNCLLSFSHFLMFSIFEATVDKIQLTSPCITFLKNVNNTTLRFYFSRQIRLSMTKLPLPHLKPCIVPSKCPLWVRLSYHSVTPFCHLKVSHQSEISECYIKVSY